MKKYLIITVPLLLLAVSCSQDEPAAEDNGYDTVKVTLDASFSDAIVSETGSKASLEEMGNPDIWCFAYDRNSDGPYTPVGGSPIKQDSFSGNRYTFTLPKLDNGMFAFAVIPDGVSCNDILDNYANPCLYFTATDPYSDNMVYCSEFTYENTNTESPVSFNTTLIQTFIKFEIVFDCENFPGPVQDYLTNWGMYIGASGNDYYYDGLLDFDSLEQVEDSENPSGRFSYRFTFMPDNANIKDISSCLRLIRLTFNTADLEVYSSYETLSSTYSKNRQITISIDYNDIKEN